MKRVARITLIMIAVPLQLLVALTAAGAGTKTDDLAQCLVRSTTSSDKSTLVQWFFSLAALHPDVKWMVNMSESQRMTLNTQAARMFENLLAVSCASETREALKADKGAIGASFSVLGQVAARELFANPNVSEGVKAFSKAVDLDKINKQIRDEK